MKLFGLLSLVFATSLGMKLKEPVVNEVVAMVESGLGETKEGRALFITLTLTESTCCIATSLTECTTATARSGDEQQHVSTGPAILTRAHTGEKVDVHAIKPSKTQEMFDRMDIDGVIHEHEDPISSGSLSFREVRMENMGKSCGRSDAIEGIERRPRFVIPTVSSAVTNLTSTTYSTTYTFSAPSTLYFGFCEFLNISRGHRLPLRHGGGHLQGLEKEYGVADGIVLEAKATSQESCCKCLGPSGQVTCLKSDSLRALNSKAAFDHSPLL